MVEVLVPVDLIQMLLGTSCAFNLVLLLGVLALRRRLKRMANKL